MQIVNLTHDGLLIDTNQDPHSIESLFQCSQLEKHKSSLHQYAPLSFKCSLSLYCEDYRILI